MTSPVRIVALISGGGRTVCNLQNEILKGQVDASIVRVVASREDISGVERTRELGLDVQVPTGPDYGQELAELVDSCKPDLICLCGYLRKLSLRPQWQGRVINIHPSLLPRHGGHGMYGLNVHKAAIESKAVFSGCTVHFVDDEYDQGPILLQRSCRIEPGDTPESLAARVFHQECIALPQAIGMIARGRASIVDGRVEIRAACEVGRGSL